ADRDVAQAEGALTTARDAADAARAAERRARAPLYREQGRAIAERQQALAQALLEELALGERLWEAAERDFAEGQGICPHLYLAETARGLGWLVDNILRPVLSPSPRKNGKPMPLFRVVAHPRDVTLTVPARERVAAQ